MYIPALLLSIAAIEDDDVGSKQPEHVMLGDLLNLSLFALMFFSLFIFDALDTPKPTVNTKHRSIPIFILNDISVYLLHDGFQITRGWTSLLLKPINNGLESSGNKTLISGKPSIS